MGLFIREMEMKPRTQGFAMAVDPQNHVHLVVKSEITGFVSAIMAIGNLLLEIRSEDGKTLQLKMPLSKIHPGHRKEIRGFVAQADECLRSLGSDWTGPCPEGLFQSTTFLKSGWI